MKELNINVCPHCGKSIHPNLVSNPHAVYKFRTDSEVQSFTRVYSCPSCSKDFIALISAGSGGKCEMIYPSPSEVFDGYISQISPNFANIYNQSLAAESYGLDEIAGMGYRKATEFLIKDYLISKYPSYKEKIINSLISKCINNTTTEGQANYLPSIDNIYLNQISSRIVWLGNDETHYFRKHTNTDINDLKTLIDIAIKHILLEYSTQTYINAIQPK